MSNITITTHKGENLRSFIINDDENKPKGFATPFKDGAYYGLAFFESGDEKISYTKCNDGFIYAVRPAVSRKTGKPFNWEIFIEKEQFDLVKPKNWQENASLVACIDAETELDRLYKTVKAQKGWVWDAFTAKNDKERKAELEKWLKDKVFAEQIREDYPAESAIPRRPSTPRRPTK